jgi:FG-GAP-like repeat/FG-GAP repeat
VTRRAYALMVAFAGAAFAFSGVAGAAGAPTPSFAATRLLAASLDPSAVAIGDLNGDAKPDLAIANSFEDADEEDEIGGTISIRLNRGDGTFEPRRDYETGAGPVSVAIGDLDGDRKPDLATANAFSGSVSVLLNGGDGSFRTRREYETGDGTVSITIADLDADGMLDLAVAVAELDRVDVLLNEGDGRFAAPVPHAAGDEPLEVASGDLDGDSMPDLATANLAEDGTVSVLLNAGKGAFVPRHDYAAGHSPVSVAIGDLNGDGRGDLAVSHFGSVSHANRVSILLNEGGGSFGTRRRYLVAEGGGPIALGDLSGDRTLDVVTVNDDASRLSVLVNRGDGTLAPSLAYPTGEGPQSVAVGDLNRDGRQDLVSTDYVSEDSNTVSVLMNRPGRCNVQPVLGLKSAAATEKLARGHCGVGKISFAYSKTVKRGRVVSQRPGFGAVRRSGGKVELVISRGSRR